MSWSPRCPVCQSPIEGESRWFGLVRRLPSRCPRCGVRLAYDLAGGVVVVPERAADHESPAREPGEDKRGG